MTKSAVLPPVRCEELELMRWQAAARMDGLSLSEWVRRELGHAADYTLAKVRRPPTR
jgi:hypothetical protein